VCDSASVVTEMDGAAAATILGMRSIFTALALVLVACGGQPTTADTEPVTADLATVETLYASHCAVCHGADLRGTDGGPSFLSIVYQPTHHSDTAFLLAVRNGSRAHHWNFGDMPPVPGLSDAEVASITAFIRAAQEREGFEPYPP
jgi:mono/diheme cytochrome c family protein